MSRLTWIRVDRPLRPLLTGLIWPAAALIFAASMILYPREVFNASLRGLDAWWTVVFPALLPFFVVSELMMALGIVDFLGVLLEPVMRPLFNLPGQGAFVMAIGYTSGAPIGSMLTAKLRQQRLCTRLEGERLMSFTNNASPLFLFVAVSVGMFQDASLGVVVAGAHYLANLMLGVLLRFHGLHDTEKMAEIPRRGNLLRRALLAMDRAQQKNPRPPGKILGDAIRNSVQTLTTIGGFIILFSVIIQVLTLVGVIHSVAAILAFFLRPLGFPPDLITATASGLLEMTMGAKLSSETGASLYHQVIAVSMILGWSGLSVHTQVASMIAETDLRMGLFITTRIAHGALAALLAAAFMGPAQPVFLHISPRFAPATSLFSWWGGTGIALGMLAIGALLPLTLHAAWGLGRRGWPR